MMISQFSMLIYVAYVSPKHSLRTLMLIVIVYQATVQRTILDLLQQVGGVSLFIKNNNNYTIRKDLNMLNNNIETMFIEIDKGMFAGFEKNPLL